MAKISVVINTLNESRYLSQCLSSVKGFADEIVDVDMGSEDETVAIAKKLGAQVYSHKRLSYVEPARNFALKKATGDWILLLDPDEELQPSLAKELKAIAESDSCNFVRIPRKNIIFGKWMEHSRWWPDYNIRFFKEGMVDWDNEIHSIPVTKGEGLNIEPKENLAILHHHYETIEQYLTRLNRYTTVQAQNKFDAHYKFNWTDFISKPSNEFLSRYFAGEGYKDGLHGLALSFLQSFSELITYLKIWQLEKFTEHKLQLDEVISEFKKTEKDMHYWQADTLLKTEGGLKHRIRRKFRF
jgi:(heptosyl)LPS beta-1,4-glucosyltransferase